MKRKITVIALTLALIVTMMPIYTGVAFAGTVTLGDVLTFYNTGSDSIIISSVMFKDNCVYGTTSGGAVEMTTETAISIGAINGAWNWAVEKNDPGSSEGAFTLVLNDFNVTGLAVVNKGVLDIATSCAIELCGNSSIANTSGSAIYADQPGVNLHFKEYENGNGTLTATGGDVEDDNFSAGIISSYGKISISNNSVVNATGGDANGNGMNSNSYGICAGDDITVSDSSTINAKSGKGFGYSSGIFSLNEIVSLSSDNQITATGGAITSTGGFSSGIFAGASISGSGIVYATGGNSSGSSFGLYANNDIEISNASVSAISMEIDSNDFPYSVGVFSSSGAISISNSSVNAIGGGATEPIGMTYYSIYGIYSLNNITVSDNSTINAESGKSNYHSSGIYSNGGMVSISSGCKVKAIGGNIIGSLGASSHSSGVFGDHGVSSGGILYATGGTSSGNSFGIHAGSSAINISGGSGSATASVADYTQQAFETEPTFANITMRKGAWNSPEMTWGIVVTPPSSGGSYSPSPSITTDSNGDGASDVAGGTAIFDRINKKVVITPADGFEVADVTVNGVSKGKVTELTGLLSSDKVVVTFAKSKTPEQIEAEKQAKISAGVKATRIIYPTAVRQKNGKVKLTWQKSYGFKVDYYIVYRSAKKSSGFTKVFTSKTKRYITAKNLKAGKNVYFKVIGVRKVGDNLVKTQISRVEAIKIK